VWWVAIFGSALLPACSFDPLDRCESVGPGDRPSCPMPGWLDRAFDVRVPADWDGVSPLPLVYAFHGGGGNRSAAARVTCPEGDEDHPDCLPAKANAAGYAIVLPDGTGTRPTRNLRTWNAGGGNDGWQCVSGGACRSDVDDMAYLDELHEEVERILPVDATRVYATGLSNGAAISHRYACERPDRLAAIAPVGGNNQHAAAGAACDGGVALLQIHGTEDPCWAFTDSTEACAQQDGGLKVGVDNSMQGWRVRNGCDDATQEAPLPDPADDGTSSTRITWQSCDAAVELIRIDGGGHTWPQGYQYFGTDTVGPVSMDFDGDDLILEFFDAHAR
jgi:polyhydroxybutyrate depolymerase